VVEGKGLHGLLQGKNGLNWESSATFLTVTEVGGRRARLVMAGPPLTGAVVTGELASMPEVAT
jgi:hypothetical protein